MGGSNKKPIPITNSWLWKSNTNPFSQEEEEEWTLYPLQINEKIELAFLSDKKEIDIGEYYISFGLMFQIKKSESYCRRKVKRIPTGAIASEIRLKKYAGEVPKIKTINKVFGNISGLIRLLILKSTDLKKLLTDSQSEDENNKIKKYYVPIIIKSINDTAIQLTDKEIKEANLKLIPAFNDTIFNNLLELYKTVIKSYTKQTFLYSRINKLLRDEQWDDILNLIPFIFFLIVSLEKIYCLDNFSNDLGKIPFQYKLLFQPSIRLYRGTNIPEESMFDYNPKNTKYFSWNSFTSTTTSTVVAEQFSRKKEGLCSVIFIISVINNEKVRYHSISKYSEYPNEEEVLLTPGTIFELINTTYQDNKYYVELKLICDGILGDQQVSDSLSSRSKALCCLEEIKSNSKKKEISINDLDDSDLNDIKLLLKNSDVAKINIGKLYFSKVGIKEFFDFLSHLNSLNFIALNEMFSKQENIQMFSEFFFSGNIRNLYIKPTQNDHNSVNLIKTLIESSDKKLILDSLVIDYQKSESDIEYYLNYFIKHSSIPVDEWSNMFIENILMTDVIKYVKIKISFCRLNFSKFNCNKLIESLTQSGIQELNFHMLNIDDNFLEKFVQILPISNIKCLTFYLTKVTCFNNLFKILSETKIEKLALHGYYVINEFTFIQLSPILPLTKVKTLFLEEFYCNYILNEQVYIKSVKEFSQSLKLSSVTELLLKFNEKSEIFNDILFNLHEMKVMSIHINNLIWEYDDLIKFFVYLKSVQITDLIFDKVIIKNKNELQQSLLILSIINYLNDKNLKFFEILCDQFNDKEYKTIAAIMFSLGLQVPCHRSDFPIWNNNKKQISF